MTTGRPIRETKLQATCQQLTQLAQRLGPGAKLPTVRTLSESLPASVATINSALQELETRAVLVRKHGVGIFVSADLPQHRIALFCRPAFFQAIGASPFWGLLLEHVRLQAAQNHEKLLFFFTEGDTLSEGQREALRSHHFDGVIGIGLDLTAIDWIVAQGLPLVTFAGPGPCTVGFDSTEVHRLGARVLTEQGCRKLVTIPPPEHLLSKQESGYRWGKALLSKPKVTWPDGILSCDDMLTLGLIGAFHEANVPLYGPIRIATHANVGSPVLLGWEKDLILLEVDPSQLVSLLFDLLKPALRGEALRAGLHPVPITIRYGGQKP